jgi:hypothetical protein
MLFQQGDAGHGHAPVHGFAHVVDGEQGHWGSHTNQQLTAHGVQSLGLILCVWLDNIWTRFLARDQCTSHTEFVWAALNADTGSNFTSP